MVEIVNTIRFSFPKDAARPSWDEIGDFVKTLNASAPDMDTMYKQVEDKSVCLKFKRERAFKDAMQNNASTLRFNYANGTTVEIQMSDAGGNFQYVRVTELPPEVPDRDVSLVMAKYGKVKRVTREKVPVSLGLDVFNGVRGVYMDVKKEIPSALHFINWKGNIFYQGNKDTCFICKQEGHRMISCPNKKTRNHVEKGNKEAGQPSTYAGVVNGTASSGKNNKVTETMVVEELEEQIEDLEEEHMETEEVVKPCRSSDPGKVAKQQPQKQWPKWRRRTPGHYFTVEKCQRKDGKTYTTYKDQPDLWYVETNEEWEKRIEAEREEMWKKKCEAEEQAKAGISPPKEKRKKNATNTASDTSE